MKVKECGAQRMASGMIDATESTTAPAAAARSFKAQDASLRCAQAAFSGQFGANAIWRDERCAARRAFLAAAEPVGSEPPAIG